MWMYHRRSVWLQQQSIFHDLFELISPFPALWFLHGSHGEVLQQTQHLFQEHPSSAPVPMPRIRGRRKRNNPGNSLYSWMKIISFWGSLISSSKATPSIYSNWFHGEIGEKGKGTWCDFFHEEKGWGPHCYCHTSVYQSEKLRDWILIPPSSDILNIWSAMNVVWVLEDMFVLVKQASKTSN